MSGTLKKSLTLRFRLDLRPSNQEEKAPRTARLPETELRRGLSAFRVSRATSPQSVQHQTRQPDTTRWRTCRRKTARAFRVSKDGGMSQPKSNVGTPLSAKQNPKRKIPLWAVNQRVDNPYSLHARRFSLQMYKRWSLIAVALVGLRPSAWAQDAKWDAPLLTTRRHRFDT